MTSNRGKTLLKGHALRHEGAVRYDDYGGYVDGHLRARRLRARCQCGALSEPGITQAAAQRWHRQHKDSLRPEAFR